MEVSSSSSAHFQEVLGTLFNQSVLNFGPKNDNSMFVTFGHFTLW